MLIQSLTGTKEYIAKSGNKSGTNISISSLKIRPEDPDLTINTGQIVDIAIVAPHMTDEQIKRNNEIKFLEYSGAIRLLTEYPKPPSEEEQKEMIKDIKMKEQKDKVAEIRSSDNLTLLQDIIENDDEKQDPAILRAALIRLQELEGDRIDSPEIKDGSNNII
ncbi:MAG: hypothetical protein ACFFG0_42235 [Candidatus Thorarchaeota archaeon]